MYIYGWFDRPELWWHEHSIYAEYSTLYWTGVVCQLWQLYLTHYEYTWCITTPKIVYQICTFKWEVDFIHRLGHERNAFKKSCFVEAQLPFQLDFHLWREEKVARNQFWRVCWVRNNSHVLFAKNCCMMKGVCGIVTMKDSVVPVPLPFSYPPLATSRCHDRILRYSSDLQVPLIDG